MRFLLETRCQWLLQLLALSLPFCAGHACLIGYFLGKKQAGITALSQLIEQAFVSSRPSFAACSCPDARRMAHPFLPSAHWQAKELPACTVFCICRASPLADYTANLCTSARLQSIFLLSLHRSRFVG